MQQLVFLTGGTGLVGGHLLVQLYQTDCKIRALIRKTSSFNQLRIICDFYQVPFEALYDSIEWIPGDTLDFIGLRASLKGVDTVYHCAAMVSFNKKNRAVLLKTNVQGTANMVDAAIESGVNRFCFISSIGALGNEKTNHFIDENTPRDVNKLWSAYSESKFQSELEVWRGSAEGLKVVILNPGVVLGPGLPDKGSMLLFNVASKGIPFYTDQVTGYVDVRDIGMAALELISKGIYGKRFVLVAENVDNKRLFTEIAGEYGKKGPTIHAGKGLLNVAAFLFDLYGKMTGSAPQLTKETVLSATNVVQYSSQLIQSTIHFRFTPISETIRDTSAFLKKQQK